MIKVTLILLLGLAAAALLRRRSAALRHWILAAAIVCAAVMPLAETVVPAWRLAILPASASGPAQALTLRDPGERPAIDVTRVESAAAPGSAILPLLGAAWAGGALVCVLLLAAGIVRLVRVAARAHPVGDGRWAAAAVSLAPRYRLSRPPAILQTDHPTLLFTWGLRQPKVLLPRAAGEWSDERIRVVLGHELAHVGRGDWAMQLVAECLRCAYWFNPFVWLACRRLRLESEHACDDAVLRLGVAAPDYASQLLDLARAFRQSRRSLLPAPAMARSSDLERRVRIMLNAHLDRRPVSRSSGLLVLLVLAALTVPIAGFSLGARTPSAGTDRPAASTPAVATAMSAAGAAQPLAPPATETRPPAAASRATSPAPAARPQATALGSIAISVTDQNGKYVPQVPVVVSRPSTGTSSQTQTDSAGQAGLLNLHAGEYLVTVSKPGFKTLKLNVTVEAGKTTRVTAMLQLGSISEMVVVSAAAGSNPLGPAAPAPRHAGVPATEDPCRDAVEGGCVTPPRKLVDAKPVYPARHAEAGVSGVVVIEGAVQTDGSVGDLQPAPNADPDFADAAIRAIRLWQFSPTRLGGVPMEIRMTVTVQFTTTAK
jgi:TonB family protein